MWPSGSQKAAIHFGHLHDYGCKEHNRRWRKPCTCWKERAELCTPGVLILVNFGKYIVYHHHWTMRLLNRCSDLREWVWVRQSVLGTRNMLMVLYVQMTCEIYWVWISVPWLDYTSPLITGNAICTMWCLTLRGRHITFPSLESWRLFGPHDSLHGDPEICVLTSPAEDSAAHSGLRSTAVILQPLTPSDVSSYCVLSYCARGFCCLFVS